MYAHKYLHTLNSRLWLVRKTKIRWIGADIGVQDRCSTDHVLILVHHFSLCHSISPDRCLHIWVWNYDSPCEYNHVYFWYFHSLPNDSIKRHNLIEPCWKHSVILLLTIDLIQCGFLKRTANMIFNVSILFPLPL